MIKTIIIKNSKGPLTKLGKRRQLALEEKYFKIFGFRASNHDWKQYYVGNESGLLGFGFEIVSTECSVKFYARIVI